MVPSETSNRSVKGQPPPADDGEPYLEERQAQDGAVDSAIKE
jgi:hypothetical protein